MDAREILFGGFLKFAYVAYTCEVVPVRVSELSVSILFILQCVFVILTRYLVCYIFFNLKVWFCDLLSPLELFATDLWQYVFVWFSLMGRTAQLNAHCSSITLADSHFLSYVILTVCSKSLLFRIRELCGSGLAGCFCASP